MKSQWQAVVPGLTACIIVTTHCTCTADVLYSSVSYTFLKIKILFTQKMLTFSKRFFIYSELFHRKHTAFAPKKNLFFLCVKQSFYITQTSIKGKPAKKKRQYNTNHVLFRRLQTVKTVADCPDSCRFSRQLQTVNTVSDCQDSFRLSRTVVYFKKTTDSDCKDNCNS